MKFYALFIALFPITLAAPIAAPVDARGEAATDGEMIIRIKSYNSDLIERRTLPGTKKPLTLFPVRYNRDLIKEEQKNQPST